MSQPYKRRTIPNPSYGRKLIVPPITTTNGNDQETEYAEIGENGPYYSVINDNNINNNKKRNGGRSRAPPPPCQQQTNMVTTHQPTLQNTQEDEPFYRVLEDGDSDKTHGNQNGDNSHASPQLQQQQTNMEASSPQNQQEPFYRVLEKALGNGNGEIASAGGMAKSSAVKRAPSMRHPPPDYSPPAPARNIENDSEYHVPGEVIM